MFTGDRRKMGELVAPMLDARAGVAGGDRHRGAEHLAAVADVLRAEHVMYSNILVAIENSDADRTVLEHVAAAGDADRRVAAARARRRRLGGAALRRARRCASPKRCKDDRAYLEKLCAELERAAASTTRARLAMGDPATELVQGGRRSKAST